MTYFGTDFQHWIMQSVTDESVKLSYEEYDSVVEKLTAVCQCEIRNTMQHPYREGGIQLYVCIQ